MDLMLKARENRVRLGVRREGYLLKKRTQVDSVVPPRGGYMLVDPFKATSDPRYSPLGGNPEFSATLDDVEKFLAERKLLKAQRG